MDAFQVEWFETRTRLIAAATRRELGRKLRAACRRLRVPSGQAGAMSIHIVDDREMTRLNGEHMGKRRPTDVLSFPTEDMEAVGPSLGLGDIVLNVDAVTRQGQGAPGSEPWVAEATVLLIHGLAHLLGHDHRRRGEGRRMHQVEVRGLRAAGVPDIARPYGCRPSRG
ncbi:MAG: rRNA maturation RNase YbeY [Nannocystaceae bacterium]